MTLAAVTFLIAFVVILGGYWLFVVYPEAREKTSIIKKLKGLRSQVVALGLTKPEERLSHIPAFNALLSGRGGHDGHLKRMLVEAGLTMTVGVLILLSFALGVSVAVVSWIALHSAALSVVLGLVASVIPYRVVHFKRAKRLRLFEEQFPEAIDLISRALRAGHAFTTGLGMVADEMAKPVGEEFRRLYDEQNFGMSLPEAMRSFAKRIPVLDAKFFVTAVLTQREAGGNLSEVLDNLASVMRERFKLKRQVQVASAHGRLSAWILSGLPPALALVLFILSPKFMSPLWNDPWGVQLLLLAGTLHLLGTFIISRLVRIEY